MPQDEKSLHTQEGNRFPGVRELILAKPGKVLSALSVVLKAGDSGRHICEKQVWTV